jgi:hypothetical protein
MLAGLQREREGARTRARKALKRLEFLEEAAALMTCAPRMGSGVDGGADPAGMVPLY